jgi:hypothetical protein
MAIEISNAHEAAGLFDGAPQPSVAGGIISAAGVINFVRSAIGAYTIDLERKIDDNEAIVLLLKCNLTGAVNSAVPSAAITPDGTVNVLDFQGVGREGGSDFMFYMSVWRIAYGPNATPSI